jgi:arsenite methyltransferase
MKPARIAILTLLCTSLGCSDFKRFAYEGYDRDSWQHPERVIEELAIAPGSRVADVGAGGGYFSFRLADAVGPGGRLFAVDVDEDMTDHLDERVEADGAANVTVVRGRFDDPLLPDGEIDLVFTSNTYHHIQDRVAYFARLRQDLAPGGRVAILELNDHSWFPRTFGHYTGHDVILREMTEAGYSLDRQLDFIDRQSFSIFHATP